MSANEIYHLKVLDDFACVGGDCPLTCCRFWKVTLDDETRAKWQAIPDTAFREQLFRHTAKFELNGEFHDVITMQDDGCCTHLNSEKTCSIQNRFGHDMLPATCQNYPRITRENAFYQIRSANLSCPEILRLFLFDRDRSAFSIQVNAPNTLIKTDISSYVKSHMIMAFKEIISYEKFPTQVLMMYLADLVGQLYILVNANALTEPDLKQLFSKHKNRIYELNQAYKHKKIEVGAVTKGSIWYVMIKFFTEIADKYHGVPDVKEILESLLPEEEPTESYFTALSEKLAVAQAANQNKIRNLFGEELRKYLVTSLINRGFPWEPDMKDYRISLLSVFIPFSMLQLLLWLRHSAEQEIKQEEFILLVCLVERIMSHSLIFSDALRKNDNLLQLHQYAGFFLYLI